MADRVVRVKGEVGLLARIDALATAAAGLAGEVDPALLTGAEAEQVLAGFGRVRNVVSGAMAGYAARVTETERWRQAGARSADAHVGSLTGGSAGSGRRLAETGRGLEDAPEAKKALAVTVLSVQRVWSGQRSTFDLACRPLLSKHRCTSEHDHSAPGDGSVNLGDSDRAVVMEVLAAIADGRIEALAATGIESRVTDSELRDAVAGFSRLTMADAQLSSVDIYAVDEPERGRDVLIPLVTEDGPTDLTLDLFIPDSGPTRARINDVHML